MVLDKSQICHIVDTCSCIWAGVGQAEKSTDEEKQSCHQDFEISGEIRLFEIK
jgi:hypothetical protein